MGTYDTQYARPTEMAKWEIVGIIVALKFIRLKLVLRK